MTRTEMNELYELIKAAVKDGLKEALEESGMKGPYPDSERPTSASGIEIPMLKTPTAGETTNAKAYLDTIHHWLDKKTFYGRYTVEEQIERMRKLMTEDEMNYVLTHLLSNYTPIP